MKKKLQELRLFIYKRLPARSKLQTRVRQITRSASELYEFTLSGEKPGHDQKRRIRQIILMNPYVVPTRPIQFKTIQSDDQSPGISISFTLLNQEEGRKIEASVRHLFNQSDPSGQ